MHGHTQEFQENPIKEGNHNSFIIQSWRLAI